MGHQLLKSHQGARSLNLLLPNYRNVQQPGVPQDTESSDIASLPDVYRRKVFLCYYSCWSHGRLRYLHDDARIVLIYPVRTAQQILVATGVVVLVVAVYSIHCCILYDYLTPSAILNALLSQQNCMI
ncbi:hypothetical protein BDR06DRAFT_357945 [Suillus hirtellus]|nr:hypothetical protein BDR06DRAFT_357945 [Suillus hirtellus]